MRLDHARYEIGSLLGEGGNGKVMSGTRRTDRLPVALKYIPISKIVDWQTQDDDPTLTTRVPLEAALLKRAQSIPSVIRLIEYFELDADAELAPCFVIVMERPDGVDLFTYLNGKNKNSYLEEVEASQVFAQALHIVIGLYLHGIVHCDIKDENFIIERQTGKIKIIDFGCGAFLKRRTDYPDFFYTFRGTIVV